MNTINKEWYAIHNADTIDTPALVLYKDRIAQNILNAIKQVRSVDLLRPHVKTNKSADVCAMMQEAGITKFKCATIAEAEMLGEIGAPDVLFAYQPVGPKIARLIQLVRHFPRTRYSCLIDNQKSAADIGAAFHSAGVSIGLCIDLNVGQNRTGIHPDKALALYEAVHTIPGITVTGLHAYDGQITDKDMQKRKEECDTAFSPVFELQKKISEKFKQSLTVIAGGSPTFQIHALRGDAECSPGTFVFWDWSYKNAYPEQPFDYAALLATRVVSIINETRLCIDLGHKSVGPENPLPRIHFLNAPEAVPVSHSEEHMVLTVPDTSTYALGDLLYGVPVHVCPSVSMYERAAVVHDHFISGEWKITARDKKISI
ncbi:MAG: D-TA family PLP-dependent enzyme [Bacteroidota bacterium]